MATSGEKELKRDWPVAEGLTAGTEKQTGRVMNLVPERGSIISRRRKCGIY